jgi:hypothetical protein
MEVAILAVVSEQEYKSTMTRTGSLACILSLCASSAVAAQFSIECAWIEPYYVTFDTDAKHVIFESPAQMRLRGRIIHSTEERLDFDLLRVGSSKSDLIWNAKDKKLTWVGVPGDSTRQTVIHDCVEVRLRPVLSKYDEIQPRDQ